MKNVFKILAITIILLFVQSEYVQSAEIVDSGMCGENVSWTLDDEGTLVISGEGNMYDYNLNEKSPFFEARIKKIEIGECVTSIGKYAFYGCSSLEEINIPLSVTSVGFSAFDGCSSLEEINIPSSVTSIGGYAFYGCSNLEKVNISSNLTSISNCLFYACSSLKEIDIPSSVTIIGQSAFRKCSNLKEINIPLNVTRIEYCAFDGCSSLKEVNIPSSVTFIGGYVFAGCVSLKEISIPSSVTDIGVWSGCVIKCEAGSYAENYAKENGIKYNLVSGNMNAASNKTEVTIDAAKTNSPINSNPNHVLSEAVYTEILPVYLPDGEPVILNTNMVKQYKTITLDYVLYIVNSKKITINCTVTGDADTVKEYVLYKGEEKLASSSTGDINVTLNESSIGQDFYVEVVSTKGERTKTALQLNVMSSIKAESGQLKLGEDSIVVQFPDDIPFFGGAKLEFEPGLLPFNVTRTSTGAVRVGVNLKMDMLKDESMLREFKECWKDLRNDIRKATGYGKRKLSTLKKFFDSPNHKWNFEGSKIGLTIAGYGEGKIDEETGNALVTLDFVVGVSGKHQSAVQVFFFEIPIVLTAEASLEGELEEKLTLELEYVDGGVDASFKEGDVAVNLSGKISVFGGVGIKYITAVGAFGSGELSGEFVLLSAERETGFDKVDLVLEAGLKGYVGPLKGEIVLANKTWNLYSRPGTQSLSQYTINDVVEELPYISMYNANTYQLSDDDYSTAFVAQEGKVGDIISDAFISAQPVVADIDDYVVMTYLTMDSSRPAVDSTVLMYTVYDKAKGTWSEPQKVDDNDTMDWTATLYSNGESIRLVYVEQDSLLSGDIGINELTTGMKITTATFDVESMGFVDFEDVAKSNEKVYVSRPVIAEVESVPVICWVQGPSGDYFGINSDNSIYCSNLTDEGWSDAVMLADNLNCVTELAAGSFDRTLTVACVTDGDNDLDTSYDRVITLIEGNTTTEVVTGDVGNILFDVLPGRTETALLWYEDGNIGIRTEGVMENEYLFTTDEEGVLENSVEADFDIAGNKLLYSMTEMSGDSSLYSISYEDEGFTMPIPVVSASGSINTFSADGDMVVWVDTEATVLDDSIEDYSVIGYCMYNEQYDVQTLYAEFNHDILEPGKEVAITVGVQNNTDADLSSVDVVVLDENEDIFFETTAECSIASGTAGEVTIIFNAPSSFESAEYKILVTGQKTDTVPDNNYAELNFSLTELSVSARETIYKEKGYFVVEVENESFVGTGGTVTLSDKDGNVLYTEAIADIVRKGTYSIVIEAEKLLLEADKKMIIVTVEADKEEYDTLNNTTMENVVMLNGEIPYVTVVFMNGEEELSNTVYPVGATIVPEKLPDGMLGWYELGDESRTIVTEFDDISTDVVYIAKADDEENFNNISFKHNCSFGNNFTLVYAIKQSDLEGFDNIRLLVEKDEYDGDTLTGISTKELEWTSYTISEEDYYRFDYSNIKSCEIGDEVRAVLIAEKDGVEYRSNADVYNLRDYAYNRLAASDVGEFKALLVDMLNYCAASQEYFAYRSGSLVNLELTEEQKALSRGSYAVLNNNESITVLEGKTVPKIMKNVSFGNRIEAVFAMDLSNYDDLNGIVMHVEYTNIQGINKALDIDSGTFAYDSNIGMYYGKVSSLSAAELRKVMTVTIMHNGVPVSDTITYSIETYVSKKLVSSTDEVFKSLLEKMMIYADSAQFYFE